MIQRTLHVREECFEESDSHLNGHDDTNSFNFNCTLNYIYATQYIQLQYCTRLFAIVESILIRYLGEAGLDFRYSTFLAKSFVFAGTCR